jgi:hypothetical protein
MPRKGPHISRREGQKLGCRDQHHFDLDCGDGHCTELRWENHLKMNLISSDLKRSPVPDYLEARLGNLRGILSKDPIRMPVKGR